MHVSTRSCTLDNGSSRSSVSRRGFADQAVGLRVLQSSEPGPVSSTIIDFRVGRLLGVAYVATLGNCERLALVEQLAHTLERRFVQVALEVLPLRPRSLAVHPTLREEYAHATVTSPSLIPPAYGTGRRNPQQFLREVLAEALLAEALGFNSVWVPEHHGAYSHTNTRRMMERFAREVMPHFAGQPGGHHARCA